MNLNKFYGKSVKIKDVKGNIIKGYVFYYDAGDEEDEDSAYFNVPYIMIENIVQLHGKGYIDVATLSEKEIVSIEEIK